MNVWKALITFKWWRNVRNDGIRRTLTLHAFRNKVRIDILKVRGEN